MKKRNSPCTPYREKAKGKESKPSVLFTAGLPRATRARDARERLTRVRVCVRAAVAEAVAAFHGTRGTAPSDEALWANFAWTFGYGKLLDAIDQGVSEMQAREKKISDSEKPMILQNILNRYWNARRGGAQ